jgi:hypothetical protein
MLMAEEITHIAQSEHSSSSSRTGSNTSLEAPRPGPVPTDKARDTESGQANRSWVERYHPSSIHEIIG